MKELSIEQKAKAYDEAIKKVHKFIDGYTRREISRETLEGIFPELKESEDERIRKELTEFLKSASGGFLDTTTQCKTFGKWVAWLEKQGEPELSEDFGEYIAELSKQFPEVSFAKLSRIAVRVKKWLEKQNSNVDNANKEYWRGYREGKQEILDKYSELEKQDEQKPAWSEEDKDMLENILGTYKTLEDMLDLSTEQDQDILTSMNFERVWLKSLKDRVMQQPLQEWKQENTGNLTDFENAMMHIGGSFFGENAGLDPNNTNAIKEQANLLLELVPKQEWSEEDEKRLQSCLNVLQARGIMGVTETVNTKWLKSLKGRIQPKQEWSEEDEKKRRLLISILEVNHPNGYFKVNPSNTLNMEAMHTEELVSWLKSLKQRIGGRSYDGRTIYQRLYKS